MKLSRIVLVLVFSIPLALASASASEESPDKTYRIELKLSSGEVLPLAEITAFTDTWSFSVENELLSGTFYFGTLPEKPDPAKKLYALFETSADKGKTGLRGVFWKVPAESTILLYLNEKLIAETTFKFNPAEA